MPRKKPVDAVDERIKAEVLENYSLPTNLFKRMQPPKEPPEPKKEALSIQPKSPRAVKVVQPAKPGIDYDTEITEFLKRTAYRISD